MLTPAFHFKILDTFIDVFNANGDILCEKLSCKAGGKAFNVYEFIKLYTLDNICGKWVTIINSNIIKIKASNPKWFIICRNGHGDQH